MTDRPTFDTGFSTQAMGGVFSAAETVNAMLQFESALAMALADVGIAPESEARAVTGACAEGVADSAAILETTWSAGTPIVALREEVTGRLEDGAARWFHYGATTQDAVDTGLMLQAKRGMSILEGDLVSMVRRLSDLTSEFEDAPQMGRTFLQDARPTTFGLRTAGWLKPVLDHVETGRVLAAGLPIQLGGSNGTRSGFADSSPELTAALATRLGLADSPVVWHGDRSLVWALAQHLERLARTMAKIGTDVAYLASSPVGEIRVRSGGSSSMPGKANPIDSIRAVAAAAACSGAVSMLASAPPQELDRGVGGWHVEWFALPLAFNTTAASVEAMVGCLDSLEVDLETMAASVTGDLAMSGPQNQIDDVQARAAVLLGE